MSLELLHKIRLQASIENYEMRSKLISIRLFSLSILTQVYSEEEAQIKILSLEPELIQKIAPLIIVESTLPAQIRLTSIFLLDNFAHYRGKMEKVLSAMNGSANHGHWMQILKKMISARDLREEYSFELAEALYSSLGFILATNAGGNMLITAGIISVLLDSFSSSSEVDEYCETDLKVIE
jgi:E3 ubiquitin-protein ligase HUWE1